MRGLAVCAARWLLGVGGLRGRGASSCWCGGWWDSLYTRLGCEKSTGSSSSSACVLGRAEVTWFLWDQGNLCFLGA
ncbi:hypothetical protein BT67DRAFT_231636 [Trichocladium antarcticum]|uniref:Secreted protein n=1 Tax=Trichocladium antarcticum TaxID=1450529 RepID=A0AAN6ZF64_9PEZI|nr:hypothetical protein BT67DRAFT_231636 [Trichocladium antarcticum]